MVGHDVSMMLICKQNIERQNDKKFLHGVDINKDDTCILKFVPKIFKFPQTLQYSYKRGNSNSKILYINVVDKKKEERWYTLDSISTKGNSDLLSSRYE